MYVSGGGHLGVEREGVGEVWLKYFIYIFENRIMKPVKIA
jgi:hypothetical protein